MTIKTKTVRSSKEADADEKSLKTLQTITKYLTAILFSYVLGVLINYRGAQIGDPIMLFSGVTLIVVAIVLNAVAYKRKSTGTFPCRRPA